MTCFDIEKNNPLGRFENTKPPERMSGRFDKSMITTYFTNFSTRLLLRRM